MDYLTIYGKTYEGLRLQEASEPAKFRLFDALMEVWMSVDDVNVA